MTVLPLHAVTVVNHRDVDTAERIHQVLALAYAQEATLLRVQNAAPWAQTVRHLQNADAFFLAVLHDEKMQGVISVRRDEEPGQINIASLAVHPAHQRCGVARALLSAALQRAGGAAMSVSTAADNAPALALYREFGFEPYRWGTLGEHALALVKLRRAPPG